MRILIVVILSVVLLTVSIVSAQQRPISIRYFGQSFFVVTSADGLRIVIDPFSNIGYAMPTVEADVVLVTHEHGDHNNVGLIRGNPRVFRGLAPGAADWNRVYERIGGTLVYAVPSEQGTIRGLDALFVIESGGLRIAHFGDIGQPTLSEGQLRALGPIDILMLPVGAGPFTVSVSDANRLVDQIRPKVVIPMHYKTPARLPPNWPGIDERAFVEGKPNVRRLGSHTLGFTREQLPATTQVIVMDYQ